MDIQIRLPETDWLVVVDCLFVADPPDIVRQKIAKRAMHTIGATVAQAIADNYAPQSRKVREGSW
jgi:hypothetical protein